MKKTIKIGFLALISMLMVYFLVWCSFYFFKYTPYTKSVPMHESGNYFLKTKDYDLSVKKPSFLSFTGNLAISNKDDSMSILIWPKITNKFDLGLQIKDKEGTFYSIYLDSNLKYDEKNNSSGLSESIIKPLLDEKNDEISRMYSYAKEKWGL